MRSDEKPARDAATDAPAWEPNDDADEIRYSLTALGEAALAEEARRTRGRRFRGFGPCIAIA